jgi:hypothetical protein
VLAGVAGCLEQLPGTDCADGHSSHWAGT